MTVLSTLLDLPCHPSLPSFLPSLFPSPPPLLGFDITVASEIMAVLALTTGLEVRREGGREAKGEGGREG